MKLEKKRYDDVIILRFVGEFDTFNLPLFRERVEKMIAEGDRSFILDVKLLKFINSSALGYLIRMNKELRAQGGEVVLAQPSKFVRKTLVTLGLEEVFPVFESVEDGIVHFKKGVAPGQVDLSEGTDYDESLTGAVPVLFRQREDEDAPNQVGRIVNLYDDGLLFRYEPEGEGDPVESMLEPGRKLKLKFRQPFVEKGRWFEMDGEVKEVGELTEGDERILTVRIAYEAIGDIDRVQLEQFVRDREMWRGELRS